MIRERAPGVWPCPTCKATAAEPVPRRGGSAFCGVKQATMKMTVAEDFVYRARL